MRHAQGCLSTAAKQALGGPVDGWACLPALGSGSGRHGSPGSWRRLPSSAAKLGLPEHPHAADLAAQVCKGRLLPATDRPSNELLMRLSANDVVCAHVSEVLMSAYPATENRTLVIAVNLRNRCGLDPMLVGKMVTTMNSTCNAAEGVRSTAERIRQSVDHFAGEHCDLRVNQRFLDAAGRWPGARLMAADFDLARWNPVSRPGAASGSIAFDLKTPTRTARR